MFDFNQYMRDLQLAKIGSDVNDLNSSKNNNTNETMRGGAVGLNPYRPNTRAHRDFQKDLIKAGIHRDKNGNRLVYRYTTFQRAVIILLIIIIIQQWIIIGNL